MMLEQELWKRLPTPEGRRPDFKAALDGKGESQAAQAFDVTSFASWLAAGNPWKRQESGRLSRTSDQICPVISLKIASENTHQKGPFTSQHTQARTAEA